jgi:RNA polymerase sigma factor (sigma-70 family)
MTSAAESFAVTLARASRQAMRFLRSRQLHRDARNDVIAAAMLWCWENQNKYSLTATLEQWFMGAIRNAYRDYLRGEIRNGTTEIVENMGAKDDPEYNTVLQDAVHTLAANMDEVDRAIVQLRLDDRTHIQISETLQIERSAITKRLNKMSTFLPSSAHVNTILRRVVTPPLPSSDENAGGGHQPAIDKEIAALEFAPPQGKECPPCHYCKWFEGYMPGERRLVRMEIHEPEVKRAVKNTEARKLEIAQAVRDGIL